MSEPSHHVVELRAVALAFEEKQILKSVSLKVDPLDRLVIMVPSDTLDITDRPAELCRAAADHIATALRRPTLQHFQHYADRACYPA